MRRFYPNKYINHVKRKEWKQESDMDYTLFNISRRERGWGRVEIIGRYSDYIKLVNKKMRPV